MKRPKSGRPSLQNGGETPIISVRLPRKLMTALERWQRRQAGEPNRNEAIRFLIEFALALDPEMDDGEKR